MPYEIAQFRFPMGETGRYAIEELRHAVSDFVRYAPNQGGDETPCENIRSAFGIVRSRLNQRHSILSAIGALERIADSYRDM